MQFANVFALLSLPVVGGLIVLMYILKLKRKDVIVSSTFLWRQVIRDVQANAPFQKLRRNLLLLLQLIIATLIIFALSLPFLLTNATGGKNIVLIIDTSASMQSTDVHPTRLEEARRKAYDQIAKMRSSDTMMILSASSRPEALTGFTSEKTELRRSLDALTAHDTPTNVRDALNLAADMVASRSSGESGSIVLISDGGFETQESSTPGGSPEYSLSNLNLGNTHVDYIPIGTGHDNVGITAVDFRRNLGTDTKSVQLLVVAHNFSADSKSFVEEIYEGKEMVEAHEVTLAPGAEDTEPYDIPEPASATAMTVKLDLKDDLAVDNTAYLILKPRKALKVLLIGKDNIFLEDALKVDPSIDLSKAAAYSSGKGYDVVVFNDAAPTTLPEGNYLFIHCTSNQAPVKINGAVENVAAADWERDDPVLRYVDFGSDVFGSALKAEPAGWGRQLAVAESGSLIVSGEKGRMRSVFYGFDLMQSRFMLNVSFPILVSDSVRWLGTGGDDSELGEIRTGEPITIPAPTGTGNIVVTKPNGVKRQIATAEKGGAVFTDADLAGNYSAQGKDFTYLFAANLASASESDTTPHKSLTVLDNPAAKPGKRVKEKAPLMPKLALLGLIILCVEWWVFHRRAYLS